MTAVFRREMHGYFATPVGYSFLILYTLLAGVVFVLVNIGQEMSASMNLLLSGLQLPFLLIAPLLTMRLFAEERRMRTDQFLLTQPVRPWAVVLGKWLAAAAMLTAAMLLTLVIPVVISRYAQMSARLVFSVYLGYWLLNATMLAIGVLISSLCENQITAAVLTLSVNLLLYFGEHYAPSESGSAIQSLISKVMSRLPSASRLGDFANGIISLTDVLYFCSLTALMLALTCRVLAHRRFSKG